MYGEAAPYHSSFDDPAIYRIVVHGRVAHSLSDRLEGMMIDQVVAADGSNMSVLTGELADQTALVSVLYSLYELHLSLVAVEQLSADGQSNAGHFASDKPEA